MSIAMEDSWFHLNAKDAVQEPQLERVSGPDQSVEEGVGAHPGLWLMDRIGLRHFVLITTSPLLATRS